MFSLFFTILPLKPFRVGKHFPSEGEALAGEEREDVDIVQLRLAYDDRINRMIPAPCGVVKIYDPEEEKDRVAEVKFKLKLT